MKNRRLIIGKEIILSIIALILAYYTNLNFAKVIAGIIVVYFLATHICPKTGKWIVLIGVVAIGINSIRYFGLTMTPYIDTHNATQYLQLMQLTIPRRWEYHDMWIGPIVRGKTVNLTCADEWCHEYFEEFADEVVIDENPMFDGGNLKVSVIEEYYFGLEYMTFSSTRDFFDEETLEMLERYQRDSRLYLAVEDLATTDVICVLTDDNNNMFLSSEETLEKVLKENEK